MKLKLQLNLLMTIDVPNVQECLKLANLSNVEKQIQL